MTDADISLAISVITAVTTIGILIVAWRQLYQMRMEAKRERTLTMCFAYDNDPIISKSVEKMRAQDSKKAHTMDEHDRSTLLNYFDVLAIGEAQGNYDFEIMYHQFKNIIPNTAKWLGTMMKRTFFPICWN